ncbi:MAG: aspartate kinase [Holosporaceae bacterium]|jgi:aspartate kinase|nr:aspartate kinase [Holosporaceae bacterium]
MYLVQKFGGTSVATVERIKKVAEIIALSRKKAHKVAVVVSAMAGVTNKFVGYVRNLNSFEGDPEYDQVVSSGELITAGLLAISLKNIGVDSKSYSSWQVPIFTNDNHGNASIEKIDPSNINKDIEKGIVPVICGFQGISLKNRVTTLGRGGSDLTAVAISAATGADLCEIYSDVDGVYTVDPNLYGDARRIDEMNWREMLEMSSQGTKVLQEQSVAYAMEKKVTIRVASSFVDNAGTIISDKISGRIFQGLAVTPNLSQIRVCCGKDAAFIINALKEHFIHGEVLKNSALNKFDILLDKKKTINAINIFKKNGIKSVRQIVTRKSYSKISVIGSSILPKDAKNLVNFLNDSKIAIYNFSKSDCSINVVIQIDKLMEAIRLLHKYCGLEK